MTCRKHEDASLDVLVGGVGLAILCLLQELGATFQDCWEGVYYLIFLLCLGLVIKGVVVLLRLVIKGT